MVTIDTGVPGLRERDLRNGIKELLGRGVAGIPYLGQMIARPGWVAGMLSDGGLMQFPNVMLPTGPMPYADVGKTLEESVVCWDDLKWIRDLWDGKIVVKGVHTGEDAQRVMAEGATRSSCRITVDVSSTACRAASVRCPKCWRRPATGLKCSSTVASAAAATSSRRCRSARKGVLIGRAYAYGLAAAGEPGVSRAIEILRTGIMRTMKLLGVSSVRELNRSYIDVPAGWLPG